MYSVMHEWRLVVLYASWDMFVRLKMSNGGSSKEKGEDGVGGGAINKRRRRMKKRKPLSPMSHKSIVSL